MNITDDIKPISYIKTNAAAMLSRVNETHTPIVITQHGEVKAALMDTKSYQDMKNDLGILKLMAAGENDVENGDFIKNESIFEDAKSLFRKCLRVLQFSEPGPLVRIFSRSSNTSNMIRLH